MSDSLQSKLEQIDLLKAEIDAMAPMTEKSRDELWSKYRLEWNYNSNHIEGNTLTYGETKLLLIFGETSGNHSIREYEEMKAHDVAIKAIQAWATDSARPLRETDIRSLNEIILVEPFYSPARTSDGHATRKLITPGQYKEEPNHVVTATGEIFKYAEPEEVPIKMEELLDQYVEISRQAHHVYVAAWLHYNLVIIHPFDDGNGRVCRLLMNYHLLKNDLAPVIVKSADKKNYFAALNRADAGDLDSFVEYVADQELWSLDLMLKAVKGESVEEEEDWKKELQIISKSVDNVFQKEVDAIKVILNEVIHPLFNQIQADLLAFNDLFLGAHVNMTHNLQSKGISSSNLESVIKRIETSPDIRNLNKIEIQFGWQHYKDKRSTQFSLYFPFNISFQEFGYSINFPNGDIGAYEYRYNEKLPIDSISIISNKIGQFLLQEVKNRK